MKWNMVFGALVVSVGLCSQSFGFELLDRMLGLNDCGCNSCCQKAPSCGCDKGCEPACAAAPSCAAEPSCCAAPTCCKQRCHRHCCLLDGLHSRIFGCGCGNKCNSCNSGCGGCAAPACEPACAAEPACGCNAGCGNGCCKKSCHRHCHRCLLDIFACKSCCKKSCCNSCNAEPSCGCGGGGATTAAPSDDAAPMPPAPTADPSASINGRRMLSASSKVVHRN